jgi:hypothetical protein
VSPDVVTILGGGWSAAEIDKGRLSGFVIGVNDASVLARCDAAVSMDRLWAEHRQRQLRKAGTPTWFRRAAVKNFDAWLGLTIFDCDHAESEFSDAPGTLNGTNSGGCGFNLAYQMRPKRIYLVGFDMGRGPKGECYWFPPYSWANTRGGTGDGRYREWSQQWIRPAQQCEAAGIEVINVNRRSTMPGFRNVSPAELGMLT